MRSSRLVTFLSKPTLPPSAEAWAAAATANGGVPTTAQKAILDRLLVALVAAGVGNRILYCLPCLGDTDATRLVPARSGPGYGVAVATSLAGSEGLGGFRGNGTTSKIDTGVPAEAFSSAASTFIVLVYNSGTVSVSSFAGGANLRVGQSGTSWVARHKRASNLSGTKTVSAPVVLISERGAGPTIDLFENATSLTNSSQPAVASTDNVYGLCHGPTPDGPTNGRIGLILGIQGDLSATGQRAAVVTAILAYGAEVVLDAVMSSYLSRIAGNSGTISAPTTAAISAFVAGCISDGVWELIDHFNPVRGDQLAAARVALKVGSGNSVFPLQAWAGGDYTESVGLASSTSTKYIDTGMIAGAASGGFGFHLRSTISNSSTRRPMGSSDGTLVYYVTQTTTPTYGAQYGNTGGTNLVASALPTGWHHVDRSTVSRVDLYTDGTSVAFSTTTVSGSTTARTLWVFGINVSGVIGNHSPCTIGCYGTFQTMTGPQQLLLKARIATLEATR